MSYTPITYNISLPADFCEGKLIPYMVSKDCYEFFSSLTGSVLIVVGFFGMLQPHLETLLKLMYAGIAVSGVGTILLHYKRILIFNYADVYPLLITLSLSLIALLDEIVFEFQRKRTSAGLLAPWRDHWDDVEKMNWKRSILNAFSYLFVMLYLELGLCLVIFAKDFTWDVVGVYFAVTFAVASFGGMFYLSIYKPHPVEENRAHLNKLRNVAAITGITGIIFKILDSFLCGPIVVWLFPHALFHITTSYATHCFIVFMGVYRADNNLIEGDPLPEIIWAYRIYPYFKTPNVPDIDKRHISERINSFSQNKMFSSLFRGSWRSSRELVKNASASLRLSQVPEKRSDVTALASSPAESVEASPREKVSMDGTLHV